MQIKGYLTRFYKIRQPTERTINRLKIFNLLPHLYFITLNIIISLVKCLIRCAPYHATNLSFCNKIYYLSIH